MGLTKGETLEREDLFNQREKLTNMLHDLSNEYDEGIFALKKKFLPQIGELSDKISIIRSKLYDLRVPLEDC